MKNVKNGQPPFIMTPEILRMTEAADAAIESVRPPDSRKDRVREVWASLAIAGSPLHEDQLAAILDGQITGASSRELREARNTDAIFENMGRWIPARESHLLEAHDLLMDGLMEDAGRYRNCQMRLTAGTRILHEAPPPDRVPELMETLFGWLRETDMHPLVTGALFHCEFEFIHPFADGNGRIGRLWQRAIWKSPFARFPLENMFYARQAEYFRALKMSTRTTDCAPYVEFVLSALLETLRGYGAPGFSRTPAPAPTIVRPPVASQPAAQEPVVEYPPQPAVSVPEPAEAAEIPPPIQRLLSIFSGEMSGQELQEAIGLRDRKSFRERYIVPALQAGFIEMTVPDKPNSRLQKYRKTDKAPHN